MQDTTRQDKARQEKTIQDKTRQKKDYLYQYKTKNTRQDRHERRQTSLDQTTCVYLAIPSFLDTGLHTPSSKCVTPCNMRISRGDTRGWSTQEFFFSTISLRCFPELLSREEESTVAFPRPFLESKIVNLRKKSFCTPST